nr:hypothetical protein [uncultured bacterium]
MVSPLSFGKRRSVRLSVAPSATAVRPAEQIRTPVEPLATLISTPPSTGPSAPAAPPHSPTRLLSLPRYSSGVTSIW